MAIVIGDWPDDEPAERADNEKRRRRLSDHRYRMAQVVRNLRDEGAKLGGIQTTDDRRHA